MQKNSFNAGSSRPSSNNNSRRSYGGNSGGGNNRPFHKRRPSGGGGGRSGGNRGGGAYIHPSKFVNRATPKEQVVYTPTHTFADFNLNPTLQKNLDGIGYTSPSAIQDQAIPLGLQGKDVIGLANTGTGKTAAFLLPILDKLSKNPERNSVLIMAPTRELAQQINDELKRFSGNMNIYSTVVVGGVNIQRQIRDVQRNPHVIIGTPGRIKDLMGRKVMRINNVTTFVLDEADRMLDMGFVHDIRHIAEHLPRERQTMCYSATITPTIRTLINDFMIEPETVSVRTSETSDHVDQDVIFATGKDHKLELITGLLNEEQFEKVLVFGKTKFGSQRLADTLTKSGLPAVAIHGNKSQSQRQRALNDFKSDKVKILVATDVAARGIDIPDVSHVINFDQPQTYEDYVHRIGRTGRAGKSGKALTFVEKH